MCSAGYLGVSIIATPKLKGRGFNDIVASATDICPYASSGESADLCADTHR